MFCWKTFALLVYDLTLCALALTCCFRDSCFGFAWLSWVFMPNFFLILSALALFTHYIRFDDGDVRSDLFYFQFNFVPPCLLGQGPTPFLGIQSTMSVMAHADAYSRLMLRSCLCLMLVRARFSGFRVSVTCLLIFTF